MSVSIVAQAVAAVIAIALYFLPALIADRRKRHDLLTIAMFTACFGWTIFGWVLALYWSLQPNPSTNVAGEVMTTRRTTRMNVFSQKLADRVQNRASRMAARKKSNAANAANAGPEEPG